jgi:hypothetical protein
MIFEVDAFISYAHIDNLALKEGDKGWIANFHKALEVRLAQLLGEKPRIWRDKKLQGNDFFGDEIVQQFPKTALMISILSPRYIKSEWCTREVKEFYKTASKDIGTRIGNKSRIFKIIKTAVPFDAHPPEISDTLGYEFFIADADTGKIKELSDKSPNDLEQMYWAKLDDIAHDIRDLLLQLKEPGAADASPTGEQLTVYLAETTSDLKEQRDMIKRQLIEYGYRVLPDTQMPFVESDFIETVNNFLDQSVLSVHLVGSGYGLVPEGSKQSIIMKQNELAAAASKTGKLQRLIWLLDDKQAEDERQKQFTGLLRSSPEAQYGADLFETSIEDFKSAIHDKLKELQTRATAGKNAFQTISAVYLAETNQELQEKRESIKRQLTERGCTVLPKGPLPLVYADLSECIAGLLDQCDISIHLLGDHYGVVPEETEKSIPFIQNELAEEKSKTGKLERLVWISPVVDDDDDRQQLFIGSIKKANAANPPHTLMFETPVAEMESAVFERLEKIDEKRNQAAQAAAEETVSPGGAETGKADQGPRLVYLICDRQDLDNQENDHMVKLEDFLFDSGFEVVLPVFEGNEADVMNDHHENLRTCDAVIIYYGAGSELWLRSISRDLSKIAGYGRDRPLMGKAVFLGPPASRQKERYRSQGVLTINGLAGFSPSLMNPFIEILK